MSEIHIEANNPLVVSGSDTTVYPYVYIQDLHIHTEFNRAISAYVWFRFYRLDGNTKIEAPLEYGRILLSIPNLNEVLDVVEGGSDLKNGVEQAFIMLGKAQGLI